MQPDPLADAEVPGADERQRGVDQDEQKSNRR